LGKIKILHPQKHPISYGYAVNECGKASEQALDLSFEFGCETITPFPCPCLVNHILVFIFYSVA